MDNIQIFEDKKIRTAWDEATEEWYFSVSDVVEILTDSKDVKQATTTEISKTSDPQTFEENMEVAKQGGSVAGNARNEIEQKTGRPVITSQNATELNQVIVDLIEGVAEEK